MVLWFFLALMTGAAVLTVLLPLSRRRPVVAGEGTDVAFYRDQMSEIDRDRDRGIIAEREAESARIEAGRRLLRAQAAPTSPIDMSSEPALRRRRAASALALSVVPLVGLAVYGALGSPHLASGTPPAAVPGPTAGTAARMDELATALQKIEAHLVANPDDVKAWDIVAPIYFRTARFEDAARAFREARRSGGDSVERLMGLGEALVITGKGMVSDESRAAFARGVELDPTSARGRFYLALAAEQGGDAESAGKTYRELLAGAPADAPWAGLVRSRLERLTSGGPSPEQMAAIPPGSVGPEMIEGMVGGLDARLREKGGTEPEWSRLVRSYVVLGRRDEALDRLGRARTALESQPEAKARLDQLAADLGLSSEAARR